MMEEKKEPAFTVVLSVIGLLILFISAGIAAIFDWFKRPSLLAIGCHSL